MRVMAPQKTAVPELLGNYPFLTVEAFKVRDTALRLQQGVGGGRKVILPIPLPPAKPKHWLPLGAILALGKSLDLL